VPKKEKSECKIRIKRNKDGKIVGVEREGKCTKEDMMAFTERNSYDNQEGG